MKQFLTLILSVVLSTSLFADQWMTISSPSPKEAQVKLLSSDMSTSEVNFSLEGFYLKPVRVNGDVQYVVEVDGASRLQVAGAPDLPKVATSLVIPNMDQMQIEVIASEYTDFEDITIAPSKGNLYRDVDPSSVAYEFGSAYETDAFYPSELTSTRTPYIVNNVRGQSVLVNPFQYNPVTKVLRVYHDVTVRVSSTGNMGENALTQLVDESINDVFENVFDYHFLNSEVLENRYDPIGEMGNMLIIAYPDFMEAMNPFVEWKTQKGIEVEMVSMDEVGSSSSDVANYVETYFNDNGLTFLLLVGDAAQVPTSYASGDSDNNYTYVVGSDHYPDFISGRFSAETVGHVETMVARTLEYEKTPLMDETDWYTEAMSVGSDQGPGDDNEYDYDHLRNIYTDLDAFDYTYHHEFYDGSQGGNDASGNPSATTMEGIFNQGVTVVNYTGHGSDNSWVSSGFNNNNVNNLENTGRYPFIWSVACVNGNFVPGTCFGEAWIRATDDDGNPTGCIGNMMSTINQSWNPPMEGQDAFNDILCELEAGVIRRTFGGISFNGMLQMNDEYGSQGDEMTDTWTLFGDPSVLVRTNVPQDLSVTHDPTLFIGAADMMVTVPDCEGGVAALTMNGEILGTGEISGGSTTITFTTPLEDVGTAMLVVTGFNKIPYIVDVDVIVPEGAYIVYRDVDINDAAGNNNGALDFGEDALLSIEVENVGVDNTSNVDFTLSTASSYVTITDATESVASFDAGQTIVLTDGFAIELSDDVPDQESIVFELAMTDGTETWNATFVVTANAPEFSVGNMVILDAAGNGNGRLDPGETAEIIITANNDGHALATVINTTLGTDSPYITIINGDHTISDIAAGGSAEANFLVTASAAAPIGTPVTFNYEMVMGAYSAAKDFVTPIGLIIEDWETGDLTAFEWAVSGNAEWYVQDAIVYEGDNALQSGTIDHSQESVLSLDYEVSATGNLSFYYKVSSEGNYDYLRFFIDGEEIQSWSGDIDWTMFEIEVEAGEHTFMWKYTKDNMVSSGEDCAWIDYIVLPSMESTAMTVSAGMDMTSCSDAPCTISGFASNYEYVLWTTSGTGTFDDATVPSAIYTPSADDMAAGSVTLTLTANGADTMEDAMVLSLYEAPEANAGANVELCEGENFTSVATAANYLALEWTTTGNGTFNDATALDAIYTPSAEDIAAGSVTLTLTTQSHEDCDDAVSQLVVAFAAAPEAFAGATAQICSNEELTLEATAANYQTLEWSTTGTGTFSEISALDAVYTPSTEDVTAGNVTLTLVATGNGTCADATSTLALTIVPTPSEVEFLTGDVTVDIDAVTESVYTIAEVTSATYTWVIEPAEAGTVTENGTEATIAWTAEWEGDVTVKATAANDCGEAFAEYAVSLSSNVGFGENNGIATNVYPNPANDKLHIDFTTDDAQMISVRLVNALGVTAIEMNEVEVDGLYKSNMNVASLAQGVYFLVIESDNGRSVQKVVIN